MVDNIQRDPCVFALPMSKMDIETRLLECENKEAYPSHENADDEQSVEWWEDTGLSSSSYLESFETGSTIFCLSLKHRSLQRMAKGAA